MKRHLSNAIYFFIGLLGFKASAAMAASDIFLCDPGGVIQGEATDDRHKGCIDVLAWSWGVSLPVDPTGVGGTGAPNIQDLSFTKFIDKSSPILMQGSTAGTTFPKVELHSYGTCCETEYLKITMEEVFVTSFQTGGTGGEDRPTENVSLNFAKIEYCYTFIDALGKPGVTDCYGWDAQQNESY